MTLKINTTNGPVFVNGDYVAFIAKSLGVTAVGLYSGIAFETKDPIEKFDTDIWNSFENSLNNETTKSNIKVL